jgi:hypothetical protein
MISDVPEGTIQHIIWYNNYHGDIDCEKLIKIIQLGFLLLKKYIVVGAFPNAFLSNYMFR